MPTNAYVSKVKLEVNMRISSGNNKDSPNTDRYPELTPKKDEENIMLTNKRSLHKNKISLTHIDQMDPGNKTCSL